MTELGKVEKSTGYIIDKIYYPDGRVEEVVTGFNTIVNSFNILVASLLKGQAGYKGISYWCIGSGADSWDTSTRPNPTPENIGLTKEFFRKPITAENITFLDDSGNVSSSPTNTICIKVFITKSEAIGKWRELAIVGGNATASLNSGLYINNKTHGLIDKSDEIEVERQIKFVFR